MNYKSQFKKDDRVRPIKISSFTEGLTMNSPFKLSENRKFYNSLGKLLTEAISHTFEDKGGIVVFSTDVNAVIDTSTFFKKAKGYFSGKFQTFKNRIMRYSKIDTTLKKFEDIVAYSVGNFFKGRYFDRENNKTFDEKSLSVEIIGIPSTLLVDIAESIAREFNQKEVLVKDYDNNKIFLVDTN